MAFHWYLDIEEATGNEYSIGPIVFNNNETLTLTEFLTRINLACSIAYTTGVSGGNQYTVLARIAPMAGAASGDGNIQVELEGNYATDQERALDARQLLIEYKIMRTVGTTNFKVKFGTGPHGFQALAEIAGGEDGENLGAPPRAEVTVTNESNVQSLLVPHCTITTTVTDKPPVPPDIVFIPYVGKNNKILILLAPNMGQREEVPIPLMGTDTSFIIDEYFSQKNISITIDDIATLTEPLEYRSDDPVRTYEVFRIDKKPASYSDFMGRSLGVFEEPLSPTKYSTGVSHVDQIRPNVKYYYCARSIDRHQNISNPTFIYEIELVDNAGQLFLSKKVVDFITVPKKTTTSAKRLMMIEPARVQRLYPQGIEFANATREIAPPNNTLGTAPDSVWDKKFKIRLSSRKTGKKLDLNITFKNSGIINP